ncbi:MAG: phosphate transport system substrate-binding protein [Verrucomicrobiota bacterium]|nr:phosphate transport system substrate-binding protein [Verrucomicrobiota bacterium]
MKKFVLFLAAALLAAGSASAQKLVIKGSDTLGAKMVPQVAEAFRAKVPGVVFEIAAEGSTTGIAAITDSTADIGMSSRRARPTEMSAAQAKGVSMKPIIVSYDGMAVIVNENNPVTKLTLRQVEQIFAGDVTDWSAVGGNAGPFSIYTRNTSSGTYQDWKDLAMKKRDYASSSQKMAGNEQIAAEVGKNPNGIGYVGVAYINAPGVKVVPIVNKDGQLVTPTAANVHSKSYPYARPNFFYTNGEPHGLAAQFIDYILSADGQAIVEKSGFIPVPVKS